MPDSVYNAFISYSHAADGKLAPALQSAVCRFARPWYRRAVVRVFRDQTDLSVNPHLWSSIQASLAQSAHFILLASPQAAASKWVAREVDYWLTHRTPQTLLILLTEGTIAWNEGAADFDWTRTDAVPRNLSKKLTEEPLYLDLRSISRSQLVAQDNPTFRDAVAALVSILLARPKAELIGEDVAVRRRARRAAWAGASVLSLLVVLLAATTWFALTQRNSLARSMQIVRGQKLLVEAQLVRVRSPDLLQTSALLALEANRISPSVEAQTFLRQTVAMLLSPVATFPASNASAASPAAQMTAAVFSPDGRYLATVGEGPAARLWDVDGKKEVRQFIQPDRLIAEWPAFAAAFTADGSSLITATTEGVTFWDTRSGRQTAHQVSLNNPVRSLAVSPDGRYLATGHSQREVRIVELATGRVVLRGMHDSIVNSVAFSVDSAVLVSGSNDNSARIWDVTKGTELKRLPHRFGVLGVAFGNDGTQVATGGWEGVARVWEWSSGREVRSFDHRGVIHTVAFNVDGRRLATTGEDSTARVWDLTSGLEAGRATHDAEKVSSVAFSADGKYIATAAGGTATLWRAAYGNEIALLPHPDSIVTGIAFSADGKSVVTACDTTARTWDIASGRETHRFNLGGDVQGVTYSHAGDYVAAITKPTGAQTGSTCVSSWDVASGALRRALCEDVSQSDPYSATAFAHDGSHIVLGSRQGLSVRNLTDGNYVARIKAANVDFQSHLALGSQLHYVAATSGYADTSAIQVWDAHGAELHHLAMTDQITELAFSTDERLLAAGTADGAVFVWEVSSGREIARLGLPAAIGGIAFTSDGRHLATGSRDRSVRVWTIPEGREVTRFDLGGGISGVAFSPDSELLGAASSDRTARIWRWQSQDQLAEACTHLSRNLTRDEWLKYFGDEPYRPTCPRVAP